MTRSIEGGKPGDGIEPNSKRPSALRRLQDSLAGEIIVTRAAGCRVLDLGMGAPVVARWIRRRTSQKLTVVEAGDFAAGTALQALQDLPSQGFDLIYSLWTFPYLPVTEDAETGASYAPLLRECARLLAPSGSLLIHLRNLHSLRGFISGVRDPAFNWWSGQFVRSAGRAAASQGSSGDSNSGVERWDTARGFVRTLPRDLELVGGHAMGLLALPGWALAIPLFGPAVAGIERMLRDSPYVRQFGSDVLVDLRRIDVEFAEGG